MCVLSHFYNHLPILTLDFQRVVFIKEEAKFPLNIYHKAIMFSFVFSTKESFTVLKGYKFIQIKYYFLIISSTLQ